MFYFLLLIFQFLLLNKPNLGLSETLNHLVYTDVKMTLTFYGANSTVKHSCSLSEVVGMLSSHKKNVKRVCWLYQFQFLNII